MNRQEFIENVKRSQKSLRRFLVSVCSGDIAMADDIAQETYMKAYMALESLQDDDKFNFWITKIAYNTFLNHARANKINLPIEELKGHEGENPADENFRYENLYQALDGLPAKEKSAIVLFYLEGYSSKEISNLLNISDESVRQCLSRGRKRLKSLLK